MAQANAINLTGSSGLLKFNSNVFSTLPVTQYGLLVGASSQGVTSVAPGTAGGLVVSGGASADPSYVVPTVGLGLTVTTSATQLTYNQTHGWTLIQSQTASGSSAINFSSGVSGYTNYMLVGSGMTPSTNSFARIQISSNGGSTFLAMNWGNYFQTYTATGYSNSNSGTGSITPIGDSGTTQSPMDCFTINFTNLTNGGAPAFWYETVTAGSTQVGLNLGGSYATAGAATVNYIRIDRSAGTFNGTFKLYGLA